MGRNQWSLLLLLAITFIVFSPAGNAASAENECEPPEAGLSEVLATVLAKEYDATMAAEIVKQHGWISGSEAQQALPIANTQPQLWLLIESGVGEPRMKLIQPSVTSCSTVEIASGRFPFDESTVLYFGSAAERVTFPNGVSLIRIGSGGGHDGAGFGMGWKGYEYIRHDKRQLVSVLGVSLDSESHYPSSSNDCYEVQESKGVQQYGDNHKGWPEIIVKYEQQEWIECGDDKQDAERKKTSSTMKWRWDGERYQLQE
ncbi:MAG: hypothetical protein JWQ90_3482 [Hydrocarboniphaga sp.]|nr:hypothetical protein [Hydrocarboniphaga sp.]